MPLVKLIFIFIYILLPGLVFHFLQFLQPACTLQPVDSACAIGGSSNVFKSFQYMVGEYESKGHRSESISSHFS